MPYNPYKNWEPREMPSPISLMRLVKGTGTDAQEMYYSMMSMKKTDFDSANKAVLAMTDLRKGGMDPYMLEGIDDVCKAIVRKDIEGMNGGIKRMSDVLAPFCDAVMKASKKNDEESSEKKDKPDEDEKPDEKEKGKGEDEGKKDKDAPGIPEKGEKDDGPEIDIAIADAPDDEAPADAKAPVEAEAIPEAEVPPEAPAEMPLSAGEMPLDASAPAIDMRALMAGPQAEQVAAIDPALVLKALQMLQSIGQMC